MTLEEAIKTEEAETLAYEECLNSLDDNMPTDMWNELNKSLGKQMDYHQQLAEWLKELKAYKANREGYCNWCSNLKDRHLRIEYYWIDDEGNTASYVGKTNQVATGIARFCPCCGRFIERKVNADDE